MDSRFEQCFAEEENENETANRQVKYERATAYAQYVSNRQTVEVNIPIIKAEMDRPHLRNERGIPQMPKLVNYLMDENEAALKENKALGAKYNFTDEDHDQYANTLASL